MGNELNDTYTTNGVNYRTPGHPDIISALGRALWNFLNIEEQVVAILYESQFMLLETSRDLMAGPKETALKNLKDKFLEEAAPKDVIDALENAIQHYNHVRKSYRNALSHATPYTARYDNGVYIPGLVANIPSSVNLESQDVANIALEIEKAIDSLANARSLILSYTNGKLI